MKKYFKVWKQLSVCAIGTYLSNRVNIVTYGMGKIIRFVFVLIFIFSLFRFTESLAGYSQYEVILFFLTFNLVDTIAQALFRGIYTFKDDVRRGNFDYVISKPVHPLFYALTKMTDIIDIALLIPIIGFIIYAAAQLTLGVTLFNILGYLFFIAIGMVVVLGFHILSACFSLWVIESDNFIWLYRDALIIGRFPPEIFSPVVQFIFTFIIPVAMMVGYPTKALLGFLDWRSGILVLLYASGFFIISLLLWKVSLKKYSSASS